MLLATSAHNENDLLAFYQTTAAIIPILYLAVIFQARWAEWDWLSAKARFWASIVVSVEVFVAESAALTGTITGEDVSRKNTIAQALFVLAGCLLISGPLAAIERLP
jgi:hypothetical protein